MAKVRVYELAKELAIDSKTLMVKLSELGAFVRSASSTLEPAVVRQLRQVYAAGEPRPSALAAVPTVVRRSESPRRSPGRPRPSQRRLPASVEADVVAIFGERNARAAFGSAGPGGLTSDGYDDEWRRHLIDRETFTQLVDAGLSIHEPALAAECLLAGLRASDLECRLGDQSVLAWIRQGHPPAQVARTLRECRDDPNSAHLIDNPVSKFGPDEGVAAQ